jgi:hypothetical protein
VNMGGLVSIRGVTEQPVGPGPKNRWQRIPVYTEID